ncbi:hypothetical protein JRI60_11555 [Archangium violaceum]|uniref:hypothetical protein n=1 Tax=Archangium violaceum TaxID=83451 RepID=UPI0019514521|nr:hypothetical protein [Archangium violaceum]QRN99608.1 hypothetical protein JRI60_11555 [Archangium violaceum]
MSAIITFDDSLWPLLVIRLTGALTDAEFEAFLARSLSYAQRGERHVVVSDLCQVGLFTAHQRQRQAEWTRQHEALLREQVIGNATIVTSAPVRLVLSLIFHLKAMPMPHVVVSDMGSAVRFVTQKLEESGLGADAERIRHHFGLSGIHAG